METLKFLMITAHYPPLSLGGDAKFVEYLSRALVDAGHEVSIFTSPAVYRLIRREIHRGHTGTPNDGISRHEYSPSAGMLDPLMSIVLDSFTKSREKLSETATRLHPDVTHWHNTRGLIGKPYAIPGSKCIYTSHDHYAVCPRGSLQRAGGRPCSEPLLCQFCLLGSRRPPQLWRIGGRRALKMDPGIVVLSPSEYTARRLSADGVEVDHVLRNFVPDMGQIKTASTERKHLLYIGIIEKVKGVDILLDAFYKCRDSQGFNLLFLGEGSQRRRLEKVARAMGLGDRVSFLGMRPLAEMRHILEQTAATVMPTRCAENAPLAVLESFSLGIPVIGSRSGGLPEICNERTGSTTFPSGDVNSLARAIDSLWKDRGNIAQAGRMARKAYLESFFPETHIKQYLNIIGDSRP